MENYDLIIIGGGPAGLSAAIYASRYKLNTLVLAASVGGVMAEAHKVENYPGFTTITGMELGNKMEEHAKALGTKIVLENVSKLAKEDDNIIINDKYSAGFVLLCLGTKRTKLNVPGEDEFLGKGVSYCATCDAAFFRDKDVAVVGDGNEALNAAELLLGYAKKIYLICSKKSFNAYPSLIERASSDPKVEVLYSSTVKEIAGSTFVESLELNDKKLDVQGIFIEMGGTPSAVIAKELGVKTDESGYIIVDAGQKTNVECVYAAGDITTGSGKWRQIITACSEGALAARSVYLESLKKKSEK